jgi:deazaflavin-dependent oxidoreductase (nitroreductase family)
MNRSVTDVPPGKWLRFGLRLPIWLFRFHLDFMLGDRFLMLTHTGRKSGLLRQTVIEVVQHDKVNDTYYVVSGWANKSDWYQNIHKTPQVTVQVHGRKFQSTAEFIPIDQSIERLKAYARDHPIAFSELSELFLGERMKPDSDAPERIAKKMPMVAFHPE